MLMVHVNMIAPYTNIYESNKNNNIKFIRIINKCENYIKNNWKFVKSMNNYKNNIRTMC